MEHRASLRLYQLTFVASIGGFLFGFDTAVISGTIGFVEAQFQLGPALLGWYVSSGLLGSMLGVGIAGLANDRFGSKAVLLLASVLFTLSGLGCMFARGLDDLIAYRLIGGVAIGIASVLSPLYISEIAPAWCRGRLVATYQMAITVGILAAYLSNAAWLDLSHSVWIAHEGLAVRHIVAGEPWRAMLGTETLPALAFLGLLLAIPQSPRWLALKGRTVEARIALTAIAGAPEAERALLEIEQSLQSKLSGLKLLATAGLRRATLIGIALAFFTQVSGINAVIYYGPTILERAGLGFGQALGGQVAIGAVNALATVIAIVTIDRFGRRPLLLVGISAMLVSLVVIGALFHDGRPHPHLLLGFLLLFVTSFAFSYGPVIWVLLSELYPTRVRAFAISLATMALWIGAVLTGQVTPWLLHRFGPEGAFWLFAVCTAPALFVAFRFVPETRGKSLEQIEAHWAAFRSKGDTEKAE